MDHPRTPNISRKDTWEESTSGWSCRKYLDTPIIFSSSDDDESITDRVRLRSIENSCPPVFVTPESQVSTKKFIHSSKLHGMDNEWKLQKKRDIFTKSRHCFKLFNSEEQEILRPDCPSDIYSSKTMCNSFEIDSINDQKVLKTSKERKKNIVRSQSTSSGTSSSKNKKIHSRNAPKTFEHIKKDLKSETVPYTFSDENEIFSSFKNRRKKVSRISDSSEEESNSALVQKHENNDMSAGIKKKIAAVCKKDLPNRKESQPNDIANNVPSTKANVFMITDNNSREIFSTSSTSLLNKKVFSGLKNEDTELSINNEASSSNKSLKSFDVKKQKSHPIKSVSQDVNSNKGISNIRGNIHNVLDIDDDVFEGGNSKNDNQENISMHNSLHNKNAIIHDNIELESDVLYDLATRIATKLRAKDHKKSTTEISKNQPISSGKNHPAPFNSDRSSFDELKKKSDSVHKLSEPSSFKPKSTPVKSIISNKESKPKSKDSIPMSIKNSVIDNDNSRKGKHDEPLSTKKGKIYDNVKLESDVLHDLATRVTSKLSINSQNTCIPKMSKNYPVSSEKIHPVLDSEYSSDESNATQFKTSVSARKPTSYKSKSRLLKKSTTVNKELEPRSDESSPASIKKSVEGNSKKDDSKNIYNHEPLFNENKEIFDNVESESEVFHDLATRVATKLGIKSQDVSTHKISNNYPLSSKKFHPLHLDSDEHNSDEPKVTQQGTLVSVQKPAKSSSYKTKPALLRKSVSINKEPEFTSDRSTPISIEELIDISKHSKSGNEKQRQSFLKSLSPSVSDNVADPEALRYRTQFKSKRVELTKKLFNLYNDKIFNNRLPSDMVVEWNDRLTKTAGFARCRSSRGVKTCSISLSTKVLDSACRLRDTLMHEMCHAIVWLVHGQSDGHGQLWQTWALRCSIAFPDIEVPRRCHNYKINFKYTYKCTNCTYSIGRHSKSLNISKCLCPCCGKSFQLMK